MSFCSKCGCEMPEGSAFCTNCGAAQVQQTHTPEPVAPAAEPEVVTPVAEPEVVTPVAAPEIVTPAYQEPVYQQSVEAPAATLTGSAKIFSIISMASGIASLVLFCSGPVFGIAAIIFSILAQRNTPSGVKNTMARVGLITGIIGAVLGVIAFIVAFITGFIGGFTESYNSFYYY